MVASQCDVRFTPESGHGSLALEYPLRTHAPQQTASLFDHFVGVGEQRGWHGEAEYPGGLGVDDQLELVRLFHREQQTNPSSKSFCIVYFVADIVSRDEIKRL
jgi:hypothetical protein